jgi:ribonuclease T2
MKKYWINQGASNEDFWGHEFSKHGTCFSTFDVPCYGPEYVQHEEVVQFFETAILYYRRLPTFGWLNAAGITPSNTTTYSIGQFQNALTKGYGALPYIGCSGPRYNETAAGKGSTDNGRTQISETWYYFHVSVINCSMRLAVS